MKSTISILLGALSLFLSGVNYGQVTYGVDPGISPTNTFDKYKQQKNYRLDGSLSGATLVSYDNFGRPIFNQSFNFQSGKVITDKSLYDSFGRLGLKTFPAPIPSTNDFSNEQDFVLDQGNEEYNIGDFDLPEDPYQTNLGEPYNPSSIGSTSILGNYYGNLSGGVIAESSFPFTRYHYAPDATNNIVSSSGVNGFKATNPNLSNRVYKLISGNELNYLYGLRGSYQTNTPSPENTTLETLSNRRGQLLKEVILAPNGATLIQYKSGEKLVASCVSGMENNCRTQISRLSVNEGIRVDFHLPKSHLDDVKVKFPVYLAGNWEGNAFNHPELYDIIIYDLTNNHELEEGVDFDWVQTNTNQTIFDINFYTLSSTEDHIIGFKFELNDEGKAWHSQILQFEWASIELTLIHSLDYGNWNLNYYDAHGNLTRSIQPEGINCNYDASDAYYDAGSRQVSVIRYVSPDAEIYQYNFNAKEDYNTTLSLNIHPYFLFADYDLGFGPYSNQPCEQDGENQYPSEPDPEDENYVDNMFSNLILYGSNQVVGSGESNGGLPPGIGDISSGKNIYPPDDAFSTKKEYSYKYKLVLVGNRKDQSGSDVLRTFPCTWKKVITKYWWNDDPSTPGANWNTVFMEDEMSTFNGVEVKWQDAQSFNQAILTQDNDNLSDYNSIVIKLQQIEHYNDWIITEENGQGTGVTADWIDLESCKRVAFNAIMGQEFITEPQQNVEHRFLVENYGYDLKGNLMYKDVPDAGIERYYYSDRNQLRFSQNSVQASSGQFRYYNYDLAGRVTESGVYDNALAVLNGGMAITFSAVPPTNPATNNVAYYLNRSFDFPDSYVRDKVTAEYDIAAAGIPGTLSPNYQQHYLRGKLSKSTNSTTTSWYSYNFYGNPEWVITYNADLGYSTVDYNYDENQNLIRTDYNKNDAAKAFYVKKEYAQSGELLRVLTSRDPDRHYRVQSELFYDDFGTLIRKELGSDYQGVDYRYTLEGGVKAINNPQEGAEFDPGQDGHYGSANQFFFQDLFAESLGYYPGDYVKSNSNIHTLGGEAQYDGKVMSVLWRTTEGENLALEGGMQQLGYQYTYDPIGQLSDANFGFVSGGDQNGSSGQNIAPTLSGHSNYDVNYSYDLNGNITSLSRNGGDANSKQIDALTYNYSYQNIAGLGQSLTSNRLLNIDDYEQSQTYSDELLTQAGDNYTYDANGRLGVDADRNALIKYNGFDRVSEVYDFSTDQLKRRYNYNDSRQLYKTEYFDNSENLVKVNFKNYEVGGRCYMEEDWLYDAHGGVESKIRKYYAYDNGLMATVILDNDEEEVVYELKDHVGSVRTSFSNNEVEINSSPFINSLNSWNLRVTGTVYQFMGNDGVKLSGDNVASGLVRTFDVENGKRYTIKLDVTDINAEKTFVGVVDGPSGNVLITNQQLHEGVNELSFIATSHRASVHLRIAACCLYAGNSFTIRDFVLEKDELEVLKYADYYPFGWEMPGRRYESSAHPNDFAYQGEFAQKDDELQWSQFELRNYDTRMGRWLSVDPAAQFHSLYLAMGNNPVSMVDPDGAISIFQYERARSFENRMEEMNLVGLSIEDLLTIDGFSTLGIRNLTGDQTVGKKNNGDNTKTENNPPDDGNSSANTTSSDGVLPWYSIYNWPALGTSARTMDAIYEGDYLSATGHFLTLFAEVFSLTLMSPEVSLVRQGTSKVITNTGSQAAKTGFSVNPSKFDYFFGRVVSGSEHNIARSAQNLKDLTTLGINNESQLMNVFTQAFESGTVISTKTSQYGTTIMKGVNIGNQGSINVGFFYQGGNMSATPSVSTIIPKIF